MGTLTLRTMDGTSPFYLRRDFHMPWRRILLREAFRGKERMFGFGAAVPHARIGLNYALRRVDRPARRGFIR